MGDTGTGMAFGQVVLGVIGVLLGSVLGLSFRGMRHWAGRNGHGAWRATFGLLELGAWVLMGAGVLMVASMIM